MSLPRKHIAEGIAAALMTGVGGTRGALANDNRWILGEPYLFVAGHALPNPTEADVRQALASPMVFAEGEPNRVEPIRIRERTSNADDGSGLTLTSTHGRCYEVEPIPVAARLVETTRPARRCCAPGCGDKIKDGETYEITWSDGAVSYLESGCVDWFVNGHPDYGCSNGPVEGLSL